MIDKFIPPPPSDGPAPVPVAPPGVAEVVALHQATTAPRWQHAPETLAFWWGVAADIVAGALGWSTAMRKEADAFLDATREEQ